MVRVGYVGMRRDLRGDSRSIHAGLNRRMMGLSIGRVLGDCVVDIILVEARRSVTAGSEKGEEG
jgi:hypothetical protein